MSPGRRSSGRLLLRAGLAVLVRPDLWGVAARAALRLAPSRWWSRPPHLPLPASDYLHFRMVTAYGGDGTTPARPEDLIAYLEWLRSWRSVERR